MLEVEKILKAKNIEYRLIELSNRALTVQDVVKFSKGDIVIEEICKTIIVEDDHNLNYALFIRGHDRIDFKKIGKSLKRKMKILSPLDVGYVAGVEPGAICPILLKIPIYIDERVTKLNKINFGSGNHLYGIEMNTQDFLSMVPSKILDIAQK